MKRSHRRLILITTLFVVVIFIFFVQKGLSSDNDFMKISFLDVGQGDSIFIESADGTQVLIDSGQDGSVLRELSKVMPFWDRSIDMVVATHPDKDHIGGFPEIFQRYRIDKVLDTGVLSETGIYDAYVYERDKEDAQVIIAKAGQVIDLGEGYMEVLFPGKNIDSITDKNDTSIVLRVVYGESEILLTGDASKKIEKYLVSRYGDQLQADILKLGHHGSKTSTSELFLETVNPEIVVVSAGEENRYGHPHKEVIDTVNTFGVEILSTINGIQTIELSRWSIR